MDMKMSNFYFRELKLVNYIMCGPYIFLAKSYTHTSEDNSMMLHSSIVISTFRKEFQHENHNQLSSRDIHVHVF